MSSESLGRLAVISVLATAAFAQGAGPSLFTTNKPRPLMELVRQLEGRFGWRITYEEAPYESAADLVNVVSATYLTAHPGASFLIPRPQQLSVTVPNTAPVFSAPGTGTAASGLIQAAIASVIAQANSNGGGAFAVSFSGDFAHVVPTRYRKKDGTVSAFQAILDTPVTLPSAQRTIRETVNLICTQVAAIRGIAINEGTIPTNLYHEVQSTYANNETARLVLARTFETASAEHQAMGVPPVRITWDLLFDANDKAYYLNTHAIVTGSM